MSKVILVNIPAFGHVNPSLALTGELIRRGDEVIYVNTEEFRKPIEATGARFVGYPIEARVKEIGNESSTNNIPYNAHWLVRIAERLMPFMLDMLKEEAPDYVIYDSLCGWAAMSTRLLNIPSVSLFTTFVFPPGKITPIGISQLLKATWQIAREYPAYRRTARRVEERFNVKCIALMESVANPGDLNIVFTSRAFQPFSEMFDDTYQFIGTALEQREENTDFPFEQIKHGPVIYISLGTINNQNTDFYRQCFDAFKDHHGKFILSVGRSTDIGSLGAIPDNFIVRNFVPQLAILQRTDLFITHSGMNSTAESLLNGIPMIAIPQQVEQAVVAHQLARSGAGIQLKRVNSKLLRQTVDAILNDYTTYQKQAQALGQSLRDAGGVRSAADSIHQFVRERKAVSSNT